LWSVAGFALAGCTPASPRRKFEKISTTHG
jgi:hypothetical protein